MPSPPLPAWIREATVAGYSNAHQLCPGEPRLYGTESVFGDWRCRVLLLAKDWGPSRILRARIAAGQLRPYGHDPGMRANRCLARLAAPLSHVGLLYGSALANLLRDDGRVSGGLPNRDAAMAHGVAVLGWALGQLPELRWIVCLGREAWECATAATGRAGDWREHRDSCEPLGPLVAAYHPSARVSRGELARPWAVLSARIGIDLAPAAFGAAGTCSPRARSCAPRDIPSRGPP